MTHGWAPGCRFLFTKEPLIIGLFRETWLVKIKIRHPMGLCHPEGNESGHMWMRDVTCCVTFSRDDAMYTHLSFVSRIYMYIYVYIYIYIHVFEYVCSPRPFNESCHTYGWVTWRVAWYFHVMIQCTCNYYHCHAYMCVLIYTLIYWKVFFFVFTSTSTCHVHV